MAENGRFIAKYGRNIEIGDIKMSALPKKVVVNTETGEVVNEIRDGDRIFRKESAEYLSGTTEVRKEPFMKFWDAAADALSESDVLTSAAFRVCLKLIPYIAYDSGVLMHHNGRLLDLTAINKICESIPDRTRHRGLQQLISEGVFAKVIHEPPPRYIVNPYIFLRGKRFNNTLLELFKDTKWAKLYGYNPLFKNKDI